MSADRLPNVFVNLSTPNRVKELAGRAIDGVGLLRTEFLFYALGTHPEELVRADGAERFRAMLADSISRIATAFHPRPVHVRVLDLHSNELRALRGGECEPVETNPTLGLRGVSRYRDAPALLDIQLEAVERVRRQGCDNVHVMLPFVRFPEEVAAVCGRPAMQRLRAQGTFGFTIMAETPAVLFRIDEFLELADGVSIGTNDLTQLILGVDRDNERVADLYREHDPAVLRAVAQVIRACRARQRSVVLCGRAASDTEDIVRLAVREGVSGLSVNPDAVDWVRGLIAACG